MKNLILVNLFFLTGFSLFAQEKKDFIELSGNTEMKKYINLGEHGFLIESSEGMYVKNYKLTYYTPSLDKFWEIPKPNIKGSLVLGSDVVASFDGNTVCHVGYLGSSDKNRLISVINKKGEVRSQKITDIYTSDSYEVAFCNNKYLFLIREDEEVDPHNLVLSRIALDDFSMEIIRPSLPKIDSTGYSSYWNYKDYPKVLSFWEYNCHTSDEIYLTRKAVDVKNGGNTYYIAILDQNGTAVKKRITIDAKLEGGYLKPSWDFRKINNAEAKFHHDFRSIRSANYVRRVEAEAFGGIKIDAENKMIYVYGLTGTGEHKPLASEYSGFYIYAYDFDSNPVFKIEKDITNEVADNDYFRIQATPMDRGTCLETDKDQNLAFEITTGDIESINSKFCNMVWSFDKKGSMTDYYSFSFEHPTQYHYSICFPSKSSSEAADYILKNIKEGNRKNLYYYQKTSEGEAIIENNKKDSGINILFFKTKT